MKRELTDEERGQLAGYMRNNNLGVQYSSGAPSSRNVSLEDQAEIFLVCKMFDEIDGLAIKGTEGKR